MTTVQAPSPFLADYTALIERAVVSAFLENVPDLVYFKDRAGHFIAVSQSKALRHGLADRNALVGKSDFDFFSPERARAAHADEAAIMRTGIPMVGKVEKLTWADGHETYARTTKLPLHDEFGEVIGTFGISQDVTEAKRTEDALETARRELVDASRFAGMAEVATGVLHNVGNVLNSLNVSATILATGLKQSKAESLGKLSALLAAHSTDLGQFLTEDPKGRRLPEFIASLAAHALEERARLLAEVESLQRNVDHIREIVVMQQAYATMVGIVEPLDAVTLMDDSLRMNAGALVRHDVRVHRNFQPVPQLLAERGKVLQILVNLIRNAKYAADDGGHADKVITLHIVPGAPGRVLLSVQDNGVGIPAENLTRIFGHGFTTRKTGHGFGLHSSANAAKEMKGSLTVHSDGPGQGATFTLDLPAAPPI